MKTKIINIIALLICAITVAGCFTSCTANEQTPAGTDSVSAESETTTDAVSDNVILVDKNGYELDNLPSTLKYDDKKITVLAWSDHAMREFESNAEGQTADIINDALLLRNQTVEDRLGIELVYVYKKGSASIENMSSFIKDFEVGETDKAYDYVASYSRVAPQLAVKGKLADLYEIEYMNNLTKPWWPESLVEEAALGNKLYFCTGDISTNMLWMMQAMFYNKSLIEQYNLEDPVELVNNGSWTYKKFFSMCEGKYSDDGDATKNSADSYGYCVYDVNIDDFQIASDINALKSNNGQLEMTGDFGDEKISDLISDMINFFKSEDAIHSSNNDIKTIFFEERAIFMNDRVFIIAGKDSSEIKVKIEFEYGIVPVPKYSETQKNYVSNLGHPFSMYQIPAQIEEERKQMAGAVLECLASESYRKVTPQVYEVAMKLKYVYDADSARMFDLIKSTLKFDMGRLFNLCGDYTAAAFRKTVISGKNDWFSQYRKIIDSLEGSINDINTAFGD